jgi:hypothetical protein
MSTTKRRRQAPARPTKAPPTSRTAAAAHAGSRRHAPPAPATNRNRIILFVVLGVVVVVALILAITLGTSSSPSPSKVTASSVVAEATSVPVSVADQIGRGSATALPKAITGAPLTVAGKPEVLYIGAEYCPYCATERWAMVIALSRFGTFRGLGFTQSSSTDVYPNTQTFTFHGASYSSAYLSFVPVETATNQLTASGSYQPLETPTASELQVWQSLDPGGGIPFIDFAGRYLVTGATYNPGLLQGHSAAQIAASLSNPTSPIAKGAVGAANTMVAAICNVTGQKPANVCTTPAIRGLEPALG